MDGEGETGWEQPRHTAKAQKPVIPMYLLQILEQVRARQRGEAAYAYIHSEEGKAMMVELDRLRAECDAAEASYTALCARHDAERAAEVVV
jgi:hypothetical protein